MSVIQNGTKYSFANITDTYTTLPKGNYLLKFDRTSIFNQGKSNLFSLTSTFANLLSPGNGF